MWWSLITDNFDNHFVLYCRDPPMPRSVGPGGPMAPTEPLSHRKLVDFIWVMHSVEVCLCRWWIMVKEEFYHQVIDLPQHDSILVFPPAEEMWLTFLGDWSSPFSGGATTSTLIRSGNLRRSNHNFGDDRYMCRQCLSKILKTISVSDTPSLLPAPSFQGWALPQV